MSAPLAIHSPAFQPSAAIPSEYTCEGADRSPPLTIENVPPGTRSLALIVDDPDAPDPRAPKKTWVHWVVFNLPPDTRELAAAPKDGGAGLPPGAAVGRNDWNKAGWGGPCPPIGRHRYFHKLYALDTTLELDVPTKAELEAAMRDHVLAETELIGTYEKRKR